VIVPVVVYGCHTLREERRLRACEKMMLRSVFGPKREGIRGDCRRDVS